jgi:hypothetical protein
MHSEKNMGKVFYETQMVGIKPVSGKQYIPQRM